MFVLQYTIEEVESAQKKKQSKITARMHGIYRKPFTGMQISANKRKALNFNTPLNWKSY